MALVYDFRSGLLISRCWKAQRQLLLKALSLVGSLGYGVLAAKMRQCRCRLLVSCLLSRIMPLLFNDIYVGVSHCLYLSDEILLLEVIYCTATE